MRNTAISGDSSSLPGTKSPRHSDLTVGSTELVESLLDFWMERRHFAARNGDHGIPGGP